MWVGSAAAVELTGQYTNLAFQTKNSSQREVVTDLQRLRLTLADEREAWSYQFSYDHELLYGGLVRDPVFRTQLNTPDPTWADLSAVLGRDRSSYWRHTLYRGWIAYRAGDWQLTLGRQRIAWGSGRIWNPTDRFNPVQPTALEQEQKLGVDAADLTWRYSGFGAVQLVAAPGRASYGTSRKMALRWHDTLGGVDMALLGGRIGDENVAGLDLTGNVGDAGARLELMQSWQGPRGSYAQLSTGIDYTWTTDWLPNGLYLAAEYFYNGAPGISLTAQPDRLQSLSRQLVGLLAGYDLTPLWRLDLLGIADVTRRGWFIAPRLTWSVVENVDLSFIGQWPGGRPDAEFARYNRLLAARLDWYF